jgi:DNA-binding transcriptional LysR family regulator
MLNLYQLQIFQTVTDAGSFSRAAAQLYLTQPAVSQHIQALETDLGVTLFHRGRRGITLTNSGELLLDYARCLLQLAEKTRQAVANADQMETGVFAIGASPGVGVYLLPNWIRSFNQRYPALTVTVKTAPSPEIIQAVLGGTLRLGIIEGELNDDVALHAVPLWDEEIVVAVSNQHAWHKQRTIEATDLNQQNFVMREEGSLTRAWEMQLMAKYHITPRIIAEFNSPAAIKQAVVSGLGIAILPSFVIEPETDAGQLHALRLADQALSRTLKLIWSYSDTFPSQTAQAFISHLSHEFPHLLLQVFSDTDDLRIPFDINNKALQLCK